LSVCLSVCLSVTLVYCGQTFGRIKMKLGMQAGLGPGHTVLDGGPSSPPQNGGRPLPIFGPCLLCSNGCMYQDATWYGGRPRPKGQCVRWEPSSPSPKRGQTPPNFWPMSIAAKRLHRSRCTWYGGRPRPRPHCARWGTSSPSPKRGHSPLIFADVYCAHTAGCIKMPLGMEVGLDPSDIVLYGDPAPTSPKGGTAPPIFGPCLLWPNRCMDQDATWYGGRPRSGPHSVRWEPISPPPKGAQPSQFSAHVCCGQLAV